MSNNLHNTKITSDNDVQKEFAIQIQLLSEKTIILDNELLIEKQKNKKLQKQLNHIYESKSWKLIQLLRRIKDKFFKRNHFIHQFVKFPKKIILKIENKIKKDKYLRNQEALIRKSNLFDEKWYYQKYKREISKLQRPIRHFLLIGASKGLDPGPKFSLSAYKSVYPDVRKPDTNPLLHYINIGKPEGRINPVLFSDKEYIEILYKKKFESIIDYKNPTRFTEKIQLYKLFYQKQVLCKLTDKLEVRKFIKEKIGENYLIPLIGIYNSFDEIQLASLPDQFVMKTNHGSGCVIICNNKNQLDWKLAEKKFHNWMNINYYWIHREFSYKDINPKIFLEKYLHNDLLFVPKDFKFSCFNGEPKIIEIYSDRFINLTSAYFDLDWNRLSFRRSKSTTEYPIEKPKQLDEMISIARTLSAGFPFVRVDLYLLDEKIYFGEMTFYPGAGFTKFYPDEWDTIVGSWFDVSSFY